MSKCAPTAKRDARAGGRNALRAAIADPSRPGSLAHAARARRWEALLRRFPELPDMRVLDLGGTPAAWKAAPVQPASVVIVNLDADVPRPDVPPHVSMLKGDACDLPASAAAPGGRFDLVYSNSVLEHVGGHARRRQFAATVSAMADRHWIQTPYRYFPVEPHWLFPGMQWLPFQTRVAISQKWPFGHTRSPNRPQAEHDVAEVELLSATELRSYFPTSHLWYERFATLPKSLVAWK